MTDKERPTEPSALPGTDAGESAPVAAEQTAARLEAELAGAQDQFKRALADLENYRRRFDRELERLRALDREAILRDLLPVVDNLERALAAPHGGEPGAWRAGVEAVHRQLLSLLRRQGVEPVEDRGRPFDPAWHEVVATTPVAEDSEEGLVTHVAERGYRLGERVLRPARVVVARRHSE